MTAIDARTSRTNPWFVLARLGAFGGAALAADVAFDPQHRHVPLCPFHAVTGWWCPLCGGLRSANALAHGHLVAALHDNVLLVVGGVLLAVLAGDYAIRTRRGEPPRRLRKAGAVTLIAVMAAFTVLRNLPFIHALAVVT